MLLWAQAEPSSREWLHGVYCAHAPQVRAALSRLVGPGIEPDDLLHEVFLIALAKEALLRRPEFAVGPWLYGVATKVALAARRKRKLRSWLGLEVAAELPSSDESHRGAEQKDAQRLVYAALERLTAKKRDVFVLYELQGLTGEEIAEALQLNLKTVWSRLLHARHEFNTALERLMAAELKETQP